MNKADQEKAIKLFNELFSEDLSDERQQEISHELDCLLIDPRWSDYIFWSDEYLNSDGSINFNKLFDKVSGYISAKVDVRERVFYLIESLLNRDFPQKQEIDIVNEINSLLGDNKWMESIFVNKDCLCPDGKLNKDKFSNLYSL